MADVPALADLSFDVRYLYFMPGKHFRLLSLPVHQCFRTGLAKDTYQYCRFIPVVRCFIAVAYRNWQSVT